MHRNYSSSKFSLSNMAAKFMEESISHSIFNYHRILMIVTNNKSMSYSIILWIIFIYGLFSNSDTTLYYTWLDPYLFKLEENFNSVIS